MKYATKSNTDQSNKNTAARSKAAKVANHSSDAVAQRKIANAVSNSPQMVTQREVAGAIHQSPQLTALRESSHVLPVQREADSGAATNTTGLPDGLKSGIESMSGISMDNVNVHYNSDKPAQLQALAHTQGTDIHVAPGQEKHLPHEAWHVVQQAQGRVKATMQMKGVGVNDDAGLEHEADVMGAKAASFSGQSQTAPETREVAHGAAAPVQCMPVMPKMSPEEQKKFDRMMEAMRTAHDRGIDITSGNHGKLAEFFQAMNSETYVPDIGASPAFWTGPGARDAANTDAKVAPMGKTQGGKATEEFVEHKGWQWDHSEGSWVQASSNYAEAVAKLYGIVGPHAGKPVYAFVSDGARPNNVWETVEKPILVAAGVNIEVVPVKVPATAAATP